MVNQKDKVQGKVQKGIYLLMNGAVTFVCTDSRVVGVMSNFPESCFSRSEVGRQGEDLMVEQNICVWDFCSRRAEESQVRMPNTWGIIRAGKRSQDLSWKKSSLRQGGLEFIQIYTAHPMGFTKLIIGGTDVIVGDENVCQRCTFFQKKMCFLVD